jgi:hypothetical protein
LSYGGRKNKYFEMKEWIRQVSFNSKTYLGISLKMTIISADQSTEAFFEFDKLDLNDMPHEIRRVVAMGTNERIKGFIV